MQYVIIIHFLLLYKYIYTFNYIYKKNIIENSALLIHLKKKNQFYTYAIINNLLLYMSQWCLNNEVWTNFVKEKKYYNKKNWKKF